MIHLRTTFALTLLISLVGCGGEKKAQINTPEITDAERAAIKADDDRVNAEESAGKPGGS